MKKILLLFAFILLCGQVSGMSYIAEGTKVIMEDVNYTFASQWNLSGVTRFPSTGNDIYVTVDENMDYMSINASCASCQYNIVISNLSESYRIKRDGVAIDKYTHVGNTLTINGWGSSENQYEIESYIPAGTRGGVNDDKDDEDNETIIDVPAFGISVNHGRIDELRGRIPSWSREQWGMIIGLIIFIGIVVKYK